MSQSVVYEVRLDVDAELAGEFDRWLAQHVEEMLRFDGFESAETLIPGVLPTGKTGDDAGTDAAGNRRAARIVRYRVADRDHLEAYLTTHAARMRAQGVERFGDRFSASRAIYLAGESARRTCQNCASPLRGQYCAACGQRDKNRIISLWEMLRDLVGDLFEIDSRIWRTLRPLLFRPGLLTVEYLRGRRVHFTPPLRLYLVTSLIFFLVVFFNTRIDVFDDIVIDGGPGDTSGFVPEESESGDTPAPGGEETAAEPPGESAAGAPTGVDAGRCDDIEIGTDEWGEVLEKRARHVCRRLTAEGGATQFVRDLLDNLPGMMFFFLPAIALVMVPLYPLSRRYYVEHLLFFVHYHSFFFVLLTITVLVGRLPAIPGQQIASNILFAVTVFYVPVYLFVAMRRVYGQSRLLTAVKYLLLGIAYSVALLLTFTAVVLLTALSV